jgi:hypothetical protein
MIKNKSEQLKKGIHTPQECYQKKIKTNNLPQKVKKEPTRCRKVEVLIGVNNSTCFGHHYAHHQEHNTKQTDRIRCSTLAVL